MFAKCFARTILQYVPEGSGSDNNKREGGGGEFCNNFAALDITGKDKEVEEGVEEEL